ncbi:MAG: holo-ACP synthase [Leptospirales bacterium]
MTPISARSGRILGIGVDFVSISRIDGLCIRFSERFLERVFTCGEIRESRGRSDYLAGRFAVKEAVLKAMGTGLSKGMKWREIETLTLPNGLPETQCTGEAKVRMNQRGVGEIWVSISHDMGSATAFVILTED